MQDSKPKTLAEMAAEASENAMGLVCPKCNKRGWRVYYTRPQHNKILRRRICQSCGHMVTTIERPR